MSNITCITLDTVMIAAAIFLLILAVVMLIAQRLGSAFIFSATATFLSYPGSWGWFALPIGASRCLITVTKLALQ